MQVCNPRALVEACILSKTDDHRAIGGDRQHIGECHPAGNDGAVTRKSSLQPM